MYHEEADRMSKKRGKRQKKVTDLDALEQINLHAAGIDIGAEEVYVAVPKGRDAESVRSFLTITADLQQVADWIAPAATRSSSWNPQVFSGSPCTKSWKSRGFEIYLVNARHITVIMLTTFNHFPLSPKSH